MDWARKRMVWGGKEEEMKYRNVTKRYFAHANCRMGLEMDRRLLAPEGGTGSGAGAGDGNGGAGGSAAGTGGSSGASGGGSGAAGGENKAVTFDEFLKQGNNQAEFDKRLQKGIDTAVANAREKWRVLTDDKVSEAEKLAKMTEAEKQQYLEAKRKKELDDREAEITKRELMATAKNTLTEKKLPIGLAEILTYTDAKACSDSINAVEKVFNAAVEEAVKERLKGGDPMKKAPDGDGKDDLAKQVMAAMTGGM